MLFILARSNNIEKLFKMFKILILIEIELTSILREYIKFKSIEVFQAILAIYFNVTFLFFYIF